ncbi:uncharacterized protein LOC125230405 [Leguminivora glycinivorella]|uniref:uncharacterized protein LOC125230405 n=1 Tax=Leguminivora glycinivorella TaxID=1035111 RepID=UPI00200EBDE0|nr:uncharacterized protein LOC125230405 [Leguminivora glycinivorella]
MGNKSLWVQNVLNRSSTDVIHKDKPADTRLHKPLKTIGLDEHSRQTYSVGELTVRKTPAPLVEIIKPVPEYVFCLPEQIRFINFTLGHTYTQHLRLINVSKFEVRLSVSLPKRSELKVELSGPRGLRLTAGSETELLIHFHPNDVRAFHDQLRIRTSLGKGLLVPIACYMEPPELHMFVQKMNTPAFTSTDLMAFKMSENKGNIVDLGAKLLGDQHYASLVLQCNAAHASFFLLTEDAWIDHDIQAHEKDYDINSEDDPDCEYYVNLGTAFPNRSLSTTIQIVNHSPLSYSFTWKFRPWGICTCWQEHLASRSVLEEQEEASIQLCPGAQAAKGANQKLEEPEENTRRVRLEPDRASVLERSACTVRVHVPDVGAELGTHRTVLQLILESIPIESFKQEYQPNVLCTRVADDVGPDGKVWSRVVCDIVQADIEVWWHVVPVRFVIDPPVLPIIHSRRVKAVPVSFCATQIYGVDDISTLWYSTPPMVLPSGLELSPLRSIRAQMLLPLPMLPNEYPEKDIITLKTATDEWYVNCHVTRACTTRHPALAPARHWLGVVVPGAKMHTKMEIYNNTHQDICWWATPYRWTGENPPNKACALEERTCDVCLERACTCSLLRPSRGSLDQDKRCRIEYNVYAPMTDCIVATLVKLNRTAPDTARIPNAPACDARATLLAYRVVAPRLVLEVFPCGGDKKGDCRACDLDMTNKTGGCALLRPSRALTPCCCSCYKLRITNTTPIATTVRWEAPLGGEEFLKVKFLPNDFEIGSYNDKVISIILEPRRVCRRKLFVFRAKVAHAYKPLYLLIDTAIDGVRIICDVPVGGREKHDSVISVRGIQMEIYPWDNTSKPTTPAECFEAEDRKRAIVQENICHCKFELKYIPPVKPLHPPSSVPSSTEILTTPPSLTRICECFGKTKPTVPTHKEPCCLQFRSTPIKTVKSRRLTLRNDGKVTARWRMVVRRWPRQNNPSCDYRLADFWR